MSVYTLQDGLILSIESQPGISRNQFHLGPASGPCCASYHGAIHDDAAKVPACLDR